MSGGQVYLKDSAWSLRKIRTAAMGRSEMWIEGHLRLRASGGPTGLATSGVGWRTQGFSLLWMRLRPLGGFSPRMRAARLRGGVAQLLPVEDSCTSAEGGLPCRHMATVCCSRCEPAGSRRWRSGKGGRSITTPPAAAATATSVPRAGSWRRQRRR